MIPLERVTRLSVRLRQLCDAPEPEIHGQDDGRMAYIVWEPLSHEENEWTLASAYFSVHVWPGGLIQWRATPFEVSVPTFRAETKTVDPPPRFLELLRKAFVW